MEVSPITTTVVLAAAKPRSVQKETERSSVRLRKETVRIDVPRKNERRQPAQLVNTNGLILAITNVRNVDI